VGEASAHTIPKRHFSAFDDATLYNPRHKQLGVSHPFVMGNCGGQCINQSIFDHI